MDFKVPHHNPPLSINENEAIQVANKELADFKRLIGKIDPKAALLLEQAKELFFRAKASWVQRKMAVQSSEMSPQDFDNILSELQDEHRSTWKNVKEEAYELNLEVKHPYRRAEEAERAVSPGAGNRLRLSLLHEAKRSMERLAGFPDGVLTKVATLHELIDFEIAGISRELHKGDPVEQLALRKSVKEHVSKELAGFKRVIEEVYPKAHSLLEAAKTLLEQAKILWTHGKKMVASKEWSAEKFDEKTSLLHERQNITWKQLLEDSHEAKLEVDQAYLKIEQCKQNVMPDHRIFFRHAFEDAKREAEILAGYPEGILTKVALINDCIRRGTTNLSQNLHGMAHKIQKTSQVPLHIEAWPKSSKSEKGAQIKNQDQCLDTAEA